MRKKQTITTKVEKLLDLVKGKHSCLIVMQDNPDPDAIGSAVGLKQMLARAAEVKSTLAHGGTIGRAENRALVEFLGVKMVPLADVDPRTFDLVCLVDTQPDTGNNSLVLDGDFVPHMVIDHHPRTEALKKVPFVHVDTRYGATSTMITEYLYDRDLKPSAKTATALIYGIQTDTAGLTREARKADKEAIKYLYPLHEPEVLTRIDTGDKVSRKYFQDYKTAMEQATIYGPVVYAYMKKIQHPDMVGEIADFLLRLEDIEVVLVVGIYEDELVLSCRVDAAVAVADEPAEEASRKEPAEGKTPAPKASPDGGEEDAPPSPPEESPAASAEAAAGKAARPSRPVEADASTARNAGRLVKVVVGEEGTGGGHPTMAGGRIPLGKRATRKDADEAARVCETRFIGLFGLKRKTKKDLT